MLAFAKKPAKPVLVLRPIAVQCKRYRIPVAHETLQVPTTFKEKSDVDNLSQDEKKQLRSVGYIRRKVITQSVRNTYSEVCNDPSMKQTYDFMHSMGTYFGIKLQTIESAVVNNKMLDLANSEAVERLLSCELPYVFKYGLRFTTNKEYLFIQDDKHEFEPTTIKANAVPYGIMALAALLTVIARPQEDFCELISRLWYKAVNLNYDHICLSDDQEITKLVDVMFQCVQTHMGKIKHMIKRMIFLHFLKKDVKPVIEQALEKFMDEIASDLQASLDATTS
jgi:hypothetical protein